MATTYWKYIHLAKKLALLERKSCMGSQFRHQMDAFALLIEYDHADSILLKAALIHDINEDGPKVGFHDFERIKNIDSDGSEVYNLVKEVSIKTDRNGKKESKASFLTRIMCFGTDKAKLLKLADRIANLCDLTYIQMDTDFIERYLLETQNYIAPFAGSIDNEMANVLNNLIRLNSKNLVAINHLQPN